MGFSMFCKEKYGNIYVSSYGGASTERPCFDFFLFTKEEKCVNINKISPMCPDSGDGRFAPVPFHPILRQRA